MSTTNGFRPFSFLRGPAQSTETTNPATKTDQKAAPKQATTASVQLPECSDSARLRALGSESGRQATPAQEFGTRQPCSIFALRSGASTTAV